MEAPRVGLFTHHFAALKDPRVERRKRHKLFDIITIALCACICGADSWVEVALFGRSKEQWFRSFLALPNGIPSHDTFGRVFALLDPVQFQGSFATWIQAVAEVTKGQVVAIDGKTLRRSHDRSAGRGPIHMVNVWATANGVALGQRKVDEKSNEITAIPELLSLLDVSGCIVTIDAMGCQKEIAAKIVDGGADYVLAVKANQGRLCTDIQDLFAGAEAFGFEAVPHEEERISTKGHGRIETRHCWTIADPASLAYIQDRGTWAGLTSVAKITARRCIGTRVTTEDRYYISSLGGDVRQMASAIRSHWSIENSLHWVLDIAFREDESRVRKNHGAQNLAVLRQMTLNLLKQETSLKRGMKGKRLNAAWKEGYLLKVLRGSN